MLSMKIMNVTNLRQTLFMVQAKRITVLKKMQIQFQREAYRANTNKV